MHVFLIGFMAAGKTTLGRAAAQALGWPFIDVDEWIETQQGRTVRDIFAREGEAYFRELERQALTFLAGLTQSPHIVATGGGLPCQGDNMQRLLHMGTVIYLKPTPEELISRLAQMRAERPMLDQLADEELPRHVQQLWAQREPYYAQAHYTLTGDQLHTQRVVELAQQA